MTGKVIVSLAVVFFVGLVVLCVIRCKAALKLAQEEA